MASDAVVRFDLTADIVEFTPHRKEKFNEQEKALQESTEQGRRDEVRSERSPVKALRSDYQAIFALGVAAKLHAEMVQGCGREGLVRDVVAELGVGTADASRIYPEEARGSNDHQCQIATSDSPIHGVDKFKSLRRASADNQSSPSSTNPSACEAAFHVTVPAAKSGSRHVRTSRFFPVSHRQQWQNTVGTEQPFDGKGSNLTTESSTAVERTSADLPLDDKDGTLAGEISSKVENASPEVSPGDRGISSDDWFRCRLRRSWSDAGQMHECALPSLDRCCWRSRSDSELDRGRL